MHAYELAKDDIRPGIREANPFQHIGYAAYGMSDRLHLVDSVLEDRSV